MNDEIIRHKRKLHHLKRELHHLKIASIYLKQLLDEKLKDKDGYGPMMQERLSTWIESLKYSLDAFEKVYDWLIPLLNER